MATIAFCLMRPDIAPIYWDKRAWNVCNCPADLAARRRRRVEEIVQETAGTSTDFTGVLDDWERDDVELLAMLDNELFVCSRCEWTCSEDERSSRPGHEEMCCEHDDEDDVE